MKSIVGLLLALALLPLTFSTPLTETPTPAQTHPSKPPPTAFPGLDFTKPPELARTTPAPEVPARAQGGGADVPFRQETYYRCVTRDTSTHCGWHMPVVWVGEAGGGRVRGGKGGMVGVVALVVAVLV